MVTGILFNNPGHRRHPPCPLCPLWLKKNLQVTTAIVIFAIRNKNKNHYVKVH